MGDRLEVATVNGWRAQVRHDKRVKLGAKIQQAITRDHEHKLAQAALGEPLEGSVGEKAQAAISAMKEAFWSALYALYDPRVRDIHREHSVRIRAMVDAARVYDEANRELAEFEAASNALLPMIERPQLVRLADPDFAGRVLAMADRAERVIGASRQDTPKPAPRTPLPAPNFADLIAE